MALSEEQTYGLVFAHDDVLLVATANKKELLEKAQRAILTEQMILFSNDKGVFKKMLLADAQSHDWKIGAYKIHKNYYEFPTELIRSMVIPVIKKHNELVAPDGLAGMLSSSSLLEFFFKKRPEGRIYLTKVGTCLLKRKDNE